MDKDGNFTNSVNAISWSKAGKKCQALDDRQLVYDLVSVRDREENTFLVSLIHREDPELGRHHYNFPWIGLYTKHADNLTYTKWVDDSRFDYEHWRKGEPSATKVLV